MERRSSGGEDEVEEFVGEGAVESKVDDGEGEKDGEGVGEGCGGRPKVEFEPLEGREGELDVGRPVELAGPSDVGLDVSRGAYEGDEGFGDDGGEESVPRRVVQRPYLEMLDLGTHIDHLDEDERVDGLPHLELRSLLLPPQPNHKRPDLLHQVRSIPRRPQEPVRCPSPEDRY